MSKDKNIVDKSVQIAGFFYLSEKVNQCLIAVSIKLNGQHNSIIIVFTIQFISRSC
jgi:hypothetical protein